MSQEKEKKNTIDKFKIKKDDKVKILSGKDKGKIGKVLKIIKKKDRVVVENINMAKFHRKGTQSRKSEIVEKEAPIHYSKVMLICNKCMKPVRFKMKYLDDGAKVRACRRCEEVIDA